MGQRVVRTLVCGILIALPGCVYVSGAINPFAQRREGLQETTVSGSGRDKLLLVDISGVITATERERSLGLATEESTVARVEEALREARDDTRVRAVILRLNSPGGGVTASDTIYREVVRFKEETGRPVVAALMDVATSGAYYVALAADHIIASPTTITGSIGVILMGVNVEGLMTKLGIRDQTVKSGAHKDLLSPFRDTTAEERAIVQGVIDDLHGRFVALVAQRRPQLARVELAHATDGRIFTAPQALEIGLVDRIGYVDEATEMARSAAGVERARVVMYHRRGEYRQNLYSRAPAIPDTTSPAGADSRILHVTLGVPCTSGPRFMYLWTPGWAARP